MAHSRLPSSPKHAIVPDFLAFPIRLCPLQVFLHHPAPMRACITPGQHIYPMPFQPAVLCTNGRHSPCSQPMHARGSPDSRLTSSPAHAVIAWLPGLLSADQACLVSTRECPLLHLASLQHTCSHSPLAAHVGQAPRMAFTSPDMAQPRHTTASTRTRYPAPHATGLPLCSMPRHGISLQHATSKPNSSRKLPCRGRSCSTHTAPNRLLATMHLSLGYK